MSNLIVGRELIEWLISSEIISTEQHVRRVIIDIDVTEAVCIYIEEYGSDKMLTLMPPELKGANVVVLTANRTEDVEE